MDGPWVQFSYPRFDIFVDSAYYDHNDSVLPAFFDQFESRYELMEAETGWSSEQFYGMKLQINVTGLEGVGCWGGSSIPGQSMLYLSDPLYKPGCARSEISPTLGEWWAYMSGALHESLHSINPLPLLYRDWLTEGWSEYNQYNILSQNGDITQGTADDYIYQGTSSYNWQGYVANDYRDNSVSEFEIQVSKGYDITAWMFSMMRDDYAMLFADFYDLLNANMETLEMADSMWQISDYFTDMVVIDLFGRSVGYSFAQIMDVWEYVSGSPEEGPDWGVRQWVDISWYADLQSQLTNPDTTLVEGELLPVTFINTGGVSLVNVLAALYADSELIWRDSIDIADSSTITLYIDPELPIGQYTLSLRLDENNVKMETDDFNNEATGTLEVVVSCCTDRGNVDDITGVGGPIDVADLSYLVDYLFRGGTIPPCPEQGNVDDVVGAGGPIDVADLSYLVDYLFRGGPEPPACP